MAVILFPFRTATKDSVKSINNSCTDPLRESASVVRDHHHIDAKYYCSTGNSLGYSLMAVNPARYMQIPNIPDTQNIEA